MGRESAPGLVRTLGFFTPSALARRTGGGLEAEGEVAWGRVWADLEPMMEAASRPSLRLTWPKRTWKSSRQSKTPKLRFQSESESLLFPLYLRKEASDVPWQRRHS